MTKDFIPDYKNYSLYELIEVYSRIDRTNHPDRLEAIGKEIKIRMNLTENTDIGQRLSSDKLEKLLRDFKEKENRALEIKKRSKTIYHKIFFHLLFTLMTCYLVFSNLKWVDDFQYDKIFEAIMILGMTYYLIKSILSDKIEEEGFYIKKTENKKLYYADIIISSIIIIVLLVAIFRI